MSFPPIKYLISQNISKICNEIKMNDSWVLFPHTIFYILHKNEHNVKVQMYVKWCVEYNCGGLTNWSLSNKAPLVKGRERPVDAELALSEPTGE